jgi:hypothetical protein
MQVIVPLIWCRGSSAAGHSAGSVNPENGQLEIQNPQPRTADAAIPDSREHRDLQAKLLDSFFPSLTIDAIQRKAALDGSGVPGTLSSKHVSDACPLSLKDKPGLPVETSADSYSEAIKEFQARTNSYWDDVSSAKQIRKASKIDCWVTDQPPVYKGPDDPSNPGDKKPPRPPSTLPNLNEMLAASGELNSMASDNKSHAHFSLKEVSEIDFKARYVDEVTRKFSHDFHFDKAQTQTVVQGVYAFENGGWGTRETLSSTPESLVDEDPNNPDYAAIKEARRNFRPVSTAIGYNQLICANTLTNIGETPSNTGIVKSLEEDARLYPERAQEFLDRASMIKSLQPILNREVIAFAGAKMEKAAESAQTDAEKAAAKEKVRARYLDSEGAPTWSAYVDFTRSKDPTSLVRADGQPVSGEDFASAIHGLNLDADVGPIMQAQELANKTMYAFKNKIGEALDRKADELKEKASAYDNLSSQQKESAISELFGAITPKGNEPKGDLADYLKEKVADFFGLSSPNPVADLREKITALKPGMDDGLIREKLTANENKLIADKVLPLKRYGGRSGPLSAEAVALLDKISYCYFQGPTGPQLLPAAIELYNLAGPGVAPSMFSPGNGDLATANVFERAAYERNPVANGRTFNELLMYIHASMNGTAGAHGEKRGQKEFSEAFKNQSPA